MKNSIKILLGLALAMIGSQAQALAISPGDIDGTACTNATCWTTTINSNLDASEVASLIGYSGILEEYYKMDEGASTDSGPFASSYQTTFNTDLSGGLIEYLTGNSIACPDCFLLVKDGKQEPAQYVFDIGNWNGTDDIALSDFWPDNGAISHIAIYGQAAQVPEPGRAKY